MKRLRSGSVVEAQHPAEPLDAFYRASGRFREVIGLDQPVLESLVIPLRVVMSGVLASRLPKRVWSKNRIDYCISIRFSEIQICRTIPALRSEYER